MNPRQATRNNMSRFLIGNFIPPHKHQASSSNTAAPDLASIVSSFRMGFASRRGQYRTHVRIGIGDGSVKNPPVSRRALLHAMQHSFLTEQTWRDGAGG